MWYLYGLTIIAGVANAIQPGQNATLAKSLGMPVTAGFIGIFVSLVIFFVGGVAVGKLTWPDLHQVGQVPWWAWLSGIPAVILLVAQLYASPAIGAATFLGTIVTVGVVVSTLLDHFGLVGFDVHPLSLGRVGGAALMIVGVVLVAAF